MVNYIKFISNQEEFNKSSIIQHLFNVMTQGFATSYITLEIFLCKNNILGILN
jgi:hypothetical protein